MKKLRTNIRRVFILAILIWAKPDGYALSIGVGLVVLGQALHFIAAGYLVKKEELITAGPYRFTRNPFYLGNFLNDIGLCIMSNNSYITIVYLVFFYLIIIPRRVFKEQAFLTEKFGEDYINYCHKVPSFIPRFWPAKLETYNGRFSWNQIIKYREIWRVVRAFGLVIVLYLMFRTEYDLWAFLQGRPLQWQNLIATPLDRALLIALGLIMIVPPVVQFGFIRRKSHL